MKKRPQWYQIRAAADGDEAEILIYDEIGVNWFGEGVSAEQLVNELNEIEASTINVRINSVGGQVFEGLAIYNALDRHSARVVTHVDGIAASIASVIAMAGDEVRIAENAFLMIHNAHGIALGDARAMRQMADTLDKVGGSLVGVYAKRTGKDRKKIQAWMDEETWFNAEEAVAEGFADEVAEERDEKVAASIEDLTARFRHVPDQIAARLRGEADRPEHPALSVRVHVDASEVEALLEKIEAAKGEPEAEEGVPAGPDPAVTKVWAESQRVLMETLG